MRGLGAIVTGRFSGEERAVIVRVRSNDFSRLSILHMNALWRLIAAEEGCRQLDMDELELVSAAGDFSEPDKETISDGDRI